MNRLRVPLLLAWRDAVRHKGRSLLIVALVALPVLVIGAADVVFRSAQATPEQQVAGELAGSSAYLWAPTGAITVTQDPTDTYPMNFYTGRTFDGSTAEHRQPEFISPAMVPIKPAADVLRLLPAGSEITAWEQGQVPISADRGSYRMARSDLLDVSSPAAGRRYRLVSGAPAAGLGEVTVSTSLAVDLGVGIGSTVSVGSPAKDLKLVGLVEAGIQGPAARAVVGLPDSVPGAADDRGTRYLVSSPTPITWDMVRQLNSHGIQVYSRAVALDPPYQPAERFDSATALGIAAGVLLGVIGLAQVVFLSGPAFAIAARRMRRQLGLATATGAGPGQVAGVVLSTGLLLGVIGSIAGTALGAVLGIVAQPLLTSWTGTRFPAVNVRMGELGLIAGIGAVTSLLAAAWPAVTALRTDPIAALARRAKPPKQPGLISLIGLIVAAAGVADIVWAATRSVPTGVGIDLGGVTQERTIWIGAGVLATQLGLIVGAPQLVALLGRLGGIFPTVPRLALRSTARHRGRSTGAIATILVATTGAVLGAVLISTMKAERAVQYRPALRAGLVTGQVYTSQGYRTDPKAAPDEASLRPSDLAAMVHRVWPDTKVGSYAGLASKGTVEDGRQLEPTMPAANSCPWFSPAANTSYPNDARITQPGAAELEVAASDPRCVGMSFSSVTAQQAHSVPYSEGSAGLQRIVVGDASFRRILTGIDDPVADAALASGKVVVLDRRYLDGSVRFTVTEQSWDPNTDQRRTGASYSVLAVLGRWSLTPVIAIVPPSAVNGLGAQTSGAGFVAYQPGASDGDLDSLRANASALGFDMSPYVENGPSSINNLPSVWLILLIAALLIIGTVLVVTALGVVDADDDSATFAAVGASARLRRALSGWSAFTTTGIGCLLGAAAGLLVGWGVFRLLQNVDNRATTMTVPWPQLAVLVIGLPIVAFGLAALFTRSKIQLIRRVE